MPQVERRSQGSYRHFRTTDIMIISIIEWASTPRKEKESEAERKIRERGSTEYGGEARRSEETDEREDERTDERNNRR